MKWIEVKVVLRHPDPQLASELVASVFNDLGQQGAVVQDPQIQTSDDWAEDADPLPEAHAVIGYFAADGRLKERRRQFERAMKRFEKQLGLTFRIRYRRVDDENWAEAWKAFFKPLKIGRQIVVKPSWQDYRPAPGEIVLELDPGMAFGTGTHPTTVLCIQMIEKHLRPGDSFLDVGTGSGILILAAARLGAGRMCGVDRDETAIAVAEGNLARNALSSAAVRLQTGDLVEGVDGGFDVVVANILTPVILRLIPLLRRVVGRCGVFICSGMIAADREGVQNALEKNGFAVAEGVLREGWLAIAARRR
jgi:ribosomal protein L11 methyltransferase